LYILLQKYKGLFRGELVIKTLASSHFQAINGVTQVRGLVLEADQSKAKAAVALSATAVCFQFQTFACSDSA
jgi:hypothetical protein